MNRKLQILTLLILGLVFFIIPPGFSAEGYKVQSKNKVLSTKNANSSIAKIIEGVVVDEKGEPLPGVSVRVKGATAGVNTDVDGAFKLSVEDTDDVIVVSFIGFTSQEAYIKGRNSLRIILVSSTQSLTEVVIRGYGTQTKKAATGSSTTVKATEIAGNINADALTALQGNAAGLQLTQQSGRPGGGIKIRIRGNSSISSGGDPLIIVDGFPLIAATFGVDPANGISGLSQINSDDIENMEVLKDAAATAIYGSRAANGVILITTKKGKVGQSNFNVNFAQGVTQPTNRIDLLNGPDYLKVVRQSIANRYNSGIAPSAMNLPAANLNNVNGFNIAVAEATDVNYLDQVLRDGKYQDLTLSGSTATQKTSLYGSASFRNEDGIEIGRGYKRGGFRLNGEHKALNEILTLGANISLNYIAIKNPGDHFSTAQSSALPIYPLYRPDDPSLYFNGYNTAGNSVGTSPAFFRENFNDATSTLRNISIAYVDLKPIKGLSIRSEWGYDLQNNSQDTYRSRDLFPAQTNNPTARVGGNGQTQTLRFNTLAWNTNNTITYTRSFKADHKATVLGGFSVMDQDKSGRTSVFEGIPLAGNTVQATVFSIANSTETQFRFASYFSRLNYSYKDKYLLEGSIRRDGSSRFGPDNMYGTFGGVSAGWIISDESFLANNKFVNYLKLRGSFGTVGNAELATDFLYLSLLNTQDSEASYGGNSGAVFSTIGNNKLKWETTVEQNIGLDFGFFNNRISGAFEYYNKDSKDLLLASNVANSSGYLNNGYTFNVGKVNNRGVELTLNSSNIVKENFKWSTSFNISHNVGTVKQLAPNIGSNVKPSLQSANNILVEGGNFGAYFLPVYAGTDPVTGTELIYQVDQEHMFATGETRLTGKLLDATQIGNNISRHRMLIPNKSADPKYYGGLSNDLSYKGFTFNTLLYFQTGNYVLDGGERAQSYPGETQSLRTSTLQGLTDPSYPLVFGSSLSGTNTTRWLHDGSYLRLRNVQLGYTIPSRLTQRYKVNSIKLYLAGQNLWTLTKYKGWDPEVFTANNNFQNANVGAGVTGYTLPQVKTFLLGLNVRF